MSEVITLATENILSPVILCFLLGLLAALGRSDLSIPEAAAKMLAPNTFGYRKAIRIIRRSMSATVLFDPAGPGCVNSRCRWRDHG